VVKTFDLKGVEGKNRTFAEQEVSEKDTMFEVCEKENIQILQEPTKVRFHWIRPVTLPRFDRGPSA
jgi:hypothetical protein